ncbi:MAG: DUF3857 domain-containing protein, partial [Sphingobacteriales bacterium]
MKRILLMSICLIQAIFSNAQNDDDDKNIVISNAKRSFKFVKGNSHQPVLVKEESDRTYLCNNYRTDVSVAEFYNDMQPIEEVSIWVDGSKRHGIVPKHEYYSSEGIFYSDARICYFNLPLLKKGSTSQVNIAKTILDPHYFTSIYFADRQAINEQEITVTVPSWMQVELKEYNFEKYHIQKSKSVKDDATIYTYSMKNLPAMKQEKQSPGASYYAPHILVMSKSAQPKDEKYVYFNTLADQYNWYRKLVLQINNDDAVIKQKADEIVKGINTDEEKVKAIYMWVQDNIRYIAFENGIAGFKPEKAQEVLAKKYGDCKGMANLLTEMLRSQKLDARRCWIGTKHIAYDYSTPSLSVDNHMIAAWMNKGKPVFLDATEKYIGFGEVAERIQGRQTLIENGDKFLLEHVPTADYNQNTSLEKRVLTVEGNHLKGHVVQTWKGENKEWILSQLNDTKQDKQENVLKRYLSEGKQNFEISNLKITNLTNYNADLKIEYDILWKDVATSFDKETYIEINNRRNLENFDID